MIARLIIPAVAGLCLTADYLSKQWARDNLQLGVSQPFIPQVLNFTLTSNTGAAFSLGAGNGNVMFMLALLMTGVISAWIIKRELSGDPPINLERIGLGCILGGAIGNLVDRVVEGRVTDFLEFAFVSFPVFNVADSLIDIGIGLMLIAALTQSRKEAQTAGATASEGTAKNDVAGDVADRV